MQSEWERVASRGASQDAEAALVLLQLEEKFGGHPVLAFPKSEGTVRRVAAGRYYHVAHALCSRGTYVWLMAVEGRHKSGTKDLSQPRVSMIHAVIAGVDISYSSCEEPLQTGLVLGSAPPVKDDYTRSSTKISLDDYVHLSPAVLEVHLEEYT